MQSEAGKAMPPSLWSEISFRAPVITAEIQAVGQRKGERRSVLAATWEFSWKLQFGLHLNGHYLQT